MKVSDIMSTDVSWVDPSAKLTDIAKMMKDKDIGSIPVVQNNMVKGIITDRDIVIRVISEGKDTNQITADQVMSADPVVIEQSEDIDKAADIMFEYQIKRLPVVKNDKLVGIIALGDLAVESIHVNEAGEALSGISRGIAH